MGRRTEMKHMAIFGAAFVVLLAGAGVAGLCRGGTDASGQNTPPATEPSMNDKAIQRLVEQEVAKQLQPAVEREVKRQLDGFVALAQQQQKTQDEKAAALADIQTKAYAVQEMLQMVRSQIELYKIQHNEQYPTIKELERWNVMLNSTTLGGDTFGPYLQDAPVNPFSSRTAVVPMGKGTSDAGWVYNEKTGELRAVISSGDARDVATLGKKEPSAWDKCVEVHP